MKENKIEIWKEELEKIRTAKEATIKKYEAKEKMLQEKINKETERIDAMNNKMIADIVRKTYGELNDDTIQKFEELMKSLETKSENSFSRI